MKNFPFVLLLLATLVAGALGQSSTSSRPRVAPTPRPPTLGNDTYKSSPPQGPPVLSGAGQRQPSAVPTATPPVDDNEVIKIETNIVTMPVSVLDRDGRFISGLQKSDFKIYEDGVEQKVDYFQSVEQPFSVILLLD